MISTKIVTEVNDDMDVMKHEIFGPVLPIMTYDSISDVVDYINKNDNPLGLYYFGRSQSEQNFVIKTVLVEEIAVKRVSSAKAKSFYKIIFEDRQEGAKFFQARTRYKPDKKIRRNLKALKEKLHFLSDN